MDHPKAVVQPWISDSQSLTEPLDVLTDLAVLLAFSLTTAWWCELLEKERWEDTIKNPWVFGVVPVTAIIISALGRIRGLEPWEYKHPGEDFEFSGVRSTLYILGLIAVVFFISWHFARAYMTLEGTLFISGGKSDQFPKYKVNLHALYTCSRAVLVLWCILFTCFLIVEDDGFDYRGALLAWVLSLIAVFPIPVSLVWLGITTGIFIQGIGANRLRFLGCDP
ncbi:unnamed protein product [Ascophyllum nodosum]